MKVLVACEYSGIVRDAFIRKGHDAMSCDILPTDNDGPHYHGEVEDLLDEPFDLVIAHPPCTYLSNSGVRWLNTEPGRWDKMRAGAKFFRLMTRFNAPKIAIENPIQHRYAIAEHGLGKPSQIIHPYMFGHPEQKATGLWLIGLPYLNQTNNVKREMMKLPTSDRNRILWTSPGPERWKTRSTTYTGIAEAMANQWG